MRFYCFNSWSDESMKGHVEEVEVKCVRVDISRARDFVTAYAIYFGREFSELSNITQNDPGDLCNEMVHLLSCRRRMPSKNKRWIIPKKEISFALACWVVHLILVKNIYCTRT
ncbi:hypothetical protein E1A91_A02G082000v1 [Gossypium mustelinum]|uniref:Uncharacterized protein n=1 Tax=Gossypium mustelinum TaxID=34275 RepID=A0A5D3A6L2_GOSMU|nr:hypothetical protein E1A91_A02G082000v1 [Gossypium mustelinum]